jgi:hypothetical protein
MTLLWNSTLEDAKGNMIADMQRLLKQEEMITRNFYRAHGRFLERDWQFFWPTFRAFVRAATKG